MATSSIFNNIVLSTEAEAEKLADALEEAERRAEARKTPLAYAEDMSMEEIMRVFGRAHE